MAHQSIELFDPLDRLEKNVVKPFAGAHRDASDVQQSDQFLNVFQLFVHKLKIYYLVSDDRGTSKFVIEAAHAIATKLHNRPSLREAIICVQKLNHDFINKHLTPLQKKVPGYSAEELSKRRRCWDLCQVFINDSPAARFWISHCSVFQIERAVFARNFINALSEQGYHGAKQLENILAVTCGSDPHRVTLRDFGEFLQRFGPFKHSFEKARAVCHYGAEDVQTCNLPWFCPRACQKEGHGAVFRRTDLPWLIRYSSKPRALTWSQRAGNVHLRIFNSDEGYFFERDKRKGRSFRFPTVVEAIQYDLYSRPPHIATVNSDLAEWEERAPLPYRTRPKPQQQIPEVSDRDYVSHRTDDLDEGKWPEGRSFPVPVAENNRCNLLVPNFSDCLKNVRKYLNPEGKLYIENGNVATKVVNKGEKLVLKLPIETWKVDEVAHFIRGFSGEVYGDFTGDSKRFLDRRINGVQLSTLTENDVISILGEGSDSEVPHHANIIVPRHANIIVQKVAELKKQGRHLNGMQK